MTRRERGRAAREQKAAAPATKQSAEPATEVAAPASPQPTVATTVAEHTLPASTSQPLPGPAPTAAPRKRILMVSHMAPYPPRAGNEQHLYRMLRWMKEAGYEVIYVLHPHEPLTAENIAASEKLVHKLHILTSPDRSSEFSRYAFGLLDLNRRVVRKLEGRDIEPPWPFLRARLEWLENLWCPPSLVEAVEALVWQYRPQAVIAQYVFMTRVLKNLHPSILRIVDTHDVFSVRYRNLRGKGLNEAVLEMSAHEEAFMLRRADVIMTSQEDEAQVIRDWGLRQRIFTIAIDMDLSPPTAAQRALENEQQVLIVASWNELNVRGVRGFLEMCWPLVRKKYPKAKLRIVGRVADNLRDQAIDDSVSVVGYVPDLEAEYRKAQVVVNPVYLGSGLKIKTVEALSFGKPLVAWDNGLTGMGKATPCLVGSHWPELASHIGALFEDPALRQQLSEQAIEYVRARYTKDVIYRPLREVIERGSPL